MGIVEDLHHEVETFTLAANFAADRLKSACGSDAPHDVKLNLGLAAYELRQYRISVDLFIQHYNEEKTSGVAANIAMGYWRLNNFQEMDVWALVAYKNSPEGTYVMPLRGHKISFLSIYAHSQFLLGFLDSALNLAMSKPSRISSDKELAEIGVKAALAKGDNKSANQLLALAGNLDQSLVNIVSSFNSSLGNKPSFFPVTMGQERSAI